MLDRLADGGAGIVDQDVDATEGFDGFRDERAAGRFLGDVRLAKFRLAAALEQARERGLRLLRVAARQHDRGAGPRQTLSHAEADAAIAAGDDRDAALQIEQIHMSLPE